MSFASTDEILMAAWQSLAQNPALVKERGFPRGFWPDLARVAVEMAIQGTLEPELDFRPTKSGEPITVVSKTKRKPLAEQLKAQPGSREVDRQAENPFDRF